MIQFDDVFIERCANDVDGPVAFALRQKLVPVEGPDAVVFPPTYAEVGYNIDTLSDGTRVATIDSVGSQANRLEPLFKASGAGASERPLADLVPQVTVTYGDEGGSVSLLDTGHRLGDALVRSTSLASEVNAAFRAYQEAGDAGADREAGPYVPRVRCMGFPRHAGEAPAHPAVRDPRLARRLADAFRPVHPAR